MSRWKRPPECRSDIPRKLWSRRPGGPSLPPTCWPAHRAFRNLAVTMKFEIRDRELSARIEGSTHLHRLARHPLAGLPQGAHDEPQRPVGHTRRIFHVDPVPPMGSLTVRIVRRRRSRRICVAQVFRPVEGVRHVAAVLQNLAAIGRPQHDSGGCATPQQRRPRAKDFLAHRADRSRRDVAERLKAHFQRDAPERVFLGKRRRHGNPLLSLRRRSHTCRRGGPELHPMAAGQRLASWEIHAVSRFSSSPILRMDFA